MPEPSSSITDPQQDVAAGAANQNLIGADLAGCDLSRQDLSGRDLSRADLTGANLNGTRLDGAVLFGATLDSAQLFGASLVGANLSEASIIGAVLGSADLTDADLFSADLSGSTLSKATLARADLRSATLVETRLLSADLTHAECRSADFGGADLTGASVDHADFADAVLGSARLRAVTGYSSANWIGADISNTDFNGAYTLRRTAMDQNYLREFRSMSRWSNAVYLAWKITSDCGRSLTRWAGLTLVMAIGFALAYTQVDIDYGDYETTLSPLYFSVVTLTTLGYGDVLPASLGAQIVVLVEVIMGYLMLGGLLSIFATKMGRRAE